MSEEKKAKLEGDLLKYVIEQGRVLEEIVKNANAEHERVRKELWGRICSEFGLPENVEGNLDMQYADQGVVIFTYRPHVESASNDAVPAAPVEGAGMGDAPAAEAQPVENASNAA